MQLDSIEKKTIQRKKDDEECANLNHEIDSIIAERDTEIEKEIMNLNYFNIKEFNKLMKKVMSENDEDDPQFNLLCIINNIIQEDYEDPSGILFNKQELLTFFKEKNEEVGNTGFEV